MELFEGQLTVDDIVNNEIPFVYDLLHSKEKLIAEKEKLRKKLEEEAQRESSSKRK